jgi:hypothetical protein
MTRFKINALYYFRLAQIKDKLYSDLFRLWIAGNLLRVACKLSPHLRRQLGIREG